MLRCPQCNTENITTSPYCERCGTSLEVANPYVVQQIEYRDYSRFSTESANAQGPSQVEYTDYTRPEIYEKMSPPSSPPPRLQGPSMPVPPLSPPSYSNQLPTFEAARPSRTVGGVLLSALLYLVGACSTGLGVAIFFIPTSNNIIVGAVFLAILCLSIIILVPTLVLHNRPRLKWWHRLLYLFATTIIAFVAMNAVQLMMTASGRLTPSSLDTMLIVTTGLGFFLYGLIASFIALW